MSDRDGRPWLVDEVRWQQAEDEENLEDQSQIVLDQSELWSVRSELRSASGTRSPAGHMTIRKHVSELRESIKTSTDENTRRSVSLFQWRTTGSDQITSKGSDRVLVLFGLKSVSVSSTCCWIINLSSAYVQTLFLYKLLPRFQFSAHSCPTCCQVAADSLSDCCWFIPDFLCQFIADVLTNIWQLVADVSPNISEVVANLLQMYNSIFANLSPTYCWFIVDEFIY